MRRVIAALVVVGLAIAVIVLWPRSDDGTTSGEATTTTSTSTTVSDPTTTSSTTGVSTSTTSVLEDNVVETVEEAEAILRELWFGWFEGIYNEDEDRIREVVVLEETVETAKESFGLEFERAPEPGDITFAETEILRSDEQCVAIWSILTTSGFQTGTTDGVYVLRRTNDRWSRLSTWIQRDDLWESDCESTLPG
jgi:hypothetical protein